MLSSLGNVWNFTSSDFKFLKIELCVSNPFQLQYCKQPTQSGKSGKISHFEKNQKYSRKLRWSFKPVKRSWEIQ